MKCDILSEYFKNNPQKKINSLSDGFNFQRDRLEQVALNKGLSNYFRDSNEYLSYRLMTIRLAEIEHRLNHGRNAQSLTELNLWAVLLHNMLVVDYIKLKTAMVVVCFAFGLLLLTQSYVYLFS